MQAINRENEQDDEIGNHHREVEGVGVINAGESLIAEPVQVMTQRVLHRETNRK